MNMISAENGKTIDDDPPRSHSQPALSAQEKTYQSSSGPQTPLYADTAATKSTEPTLTSIEPPRSPLNPSQSCPELSGTSSDSEAYSEILTMLLELPTRLFLPSPSESELSGALPGSPVTSSELYPSSSQLSGTSSERSQSPFEILESDREFRDHIACLRILAAVLEASNPDLKTVSRIEKYIQALPAAYDRRIRRWSLDSTKTELIEELRRTQLVLDHGPKFIRRALPFMRGRLDSFGDTKYLGPWRFVEMAGYRSRDGVDDQERDDRSRNLLKRTQKLLVEREPDEKSEGKANKSSKSKNGDSRRGRFRRLFTRH